MIERADFLPLNCAEFVGTTYNMRLCDVLGMGYDIGLDKYPIWDESRREWVNERIVEHFYFREIGCETATQFIFYLNRKMCEVMPWLNVVFASTDTFHDAQDLLNNEEIHVERNSSGTTESKGDGTQGAKSRTYTSTDPTISMVGKNEINYYDTGTHNDTDTESSQTGSGSYSNTDTEHRKGHYGRTLTGAIDQYADSPFSNTMLVLFGKLENLFCQTLDVPDVSFLDGFPTWCGFSRYGYPFSSF